MVELRTERPLLDLRLFKDGLFRARKQYHLDDRRRRRAWAVFLVPLLLQLEMGLSPLQSGLTTFPAAIGIALTAQPAGRLYNYVGPRRLVITGGMSGAFLDHAGVSLGRPSDRASGGSA